MSGLTKRGKPRQRVGPGASIADRIALHTRRDGNGCWIWTAALNNRGYGRIMLDRKLRYSHRVAYEAFVGPIPEGLQLDHLCRVRACCNPDHLEPVTALENTRRSPLTHASKTHCPYGHAYTPDNTMHGQDGRRRCATCWHVYIRIYRSMTFAEQMARKRAGLPIVDLAAYFAEQAQERAA